ncbi:MAG TPA: amidohydrolase family protein [Bacteroidota bacterium]|nr:amidohydrolase family protein [Bacteroidota bacterium]
MPLSPLASTHRVHFALLLLFLPLVTRAADGNVAVTSTAGDSTTVEEGKFILHKFENPIGEETYRIARTGDLLTTSIRFKFTDRGGQVPLAVTFASSADLTPAAFGIRGRSARSIRIDDSVFVEKDSVRLRDRDRWTAMPRPATFFTIGGYAPVTMQMLMLRYWASHGSPESLPTVPGVAVRIEPRGYDTVETTAGRAILRRFTVEGLIWGCETIWLDNGEHVAALVSTDAEFDHFEAAAEPYESSLGKFVGRAGTDQMAALAEFSRGIPGVHDGAIALVGGTLIDGTGAAPVKDAAVVIENGRITAAGPRGNVRIPPSAHVVNVAGKSILPGLWDMHAHFEQVEWGPIYLAAGVTTVRDCGNEFEFITAVRDAIAGGRGLGPRILCAGIVDGSGPIALGVARVDTPEESLAWVRRYHDAGFQQMKIYSSVKLEELKVVTAEAHRLGMSVTGHIPEGLNMYDAVRAGQDQINHLHYVTAVMYPPLPLTATKLERMKALADIDLSSPDALKAIEFLRDHHIVVDPTMVLAEFSTASTDKPVESFEPGAAKIAPELAAQLTDAGPTPPAVAKIEEGILKKSLEVIGALHKAGVTIVAGTDQTVPGYSLHREMELYNEAGFTPMEAIQAATIVPARVMGLDRELGTVEAGKRADLIIVNGNPLERLKDLRNVESVITNGTLYNTPELWRTAGFKP